MAALQIVANFFTPSEHNRIAKHDFVVNNNNFSSSPETNYHDDKKNESKKCHVSSIGRFVVDKGNQNPKSSCLRDFKATLCQDLLPLSSPRRLRG